MFTFCMFILINIQFEQFCLFLHLQCDLLSLKVTMEKWVHWKGWYYVCISLFRPFDRNKSLNFIKIIILKSISPYIMRNFYKIMTILPQQSCFYTRYLLRARPFTTLEISYYIELILINVSSHSVIYVIYVINLCPCAACCLLPCMN